jgi:uncharacterized repeat protein (TIGR01451 family)
MMVIILGKESTMKAWKLLVMAVAVVGIMLPGCCQRAQVEPEPMPVAQDICGAPEMTVQQQSYPIGGPANAIRLEKVAPSTISEGEAFDYRIKVTNLTASTLTNVIVTDIIPKDMMLKSSNPKMTTVDKSKVSWSLGTLEPNGSMTINASAMVTGKGPHKTCARVSYDSPVCSIISVVQPEIEIAKIAPEEALSCERIPLRYVVTNVGTGVACNVTIEDSLPMGLTTSKGDRLVKFEIASLGVDESREFNIMVDAESPGRYASKAFVASSSSGKSISNMPITIVRKPVLSLLQTSPKSQYIGRDMTFDIMLTNNGDGIAKDATVTANLPDGIKFAMATEGGIYTHDSPGKVTWKLGDVEPSASRLVRMTLTSDIEGVISARTTAEAECAETVSSKTETVLSGIAAVLMEVIDLDDPINVGGDEEYLVTITNQGSKASNNVLIKCHLESNMEYVSSTGPTLATVSNGAINFAPLASLAPKESAQWRIIVKATGVGDTRFKVEMNTDQLQRPVFETEATTFYE